MNDAKAELGRKILVIKQRRRAARRRRWPIRSCRRGNSGNSNQETRHEMEHIADLPSRLPPDERTLPRMLRRQAALYGNRRLVEIDGQRLEFRGDSGNGRALRRRTACGRH